MFYAELTFLIRI